MRAHLRGIYPAQVREINLWLEHHLPSIYINVDKGWEKLRSEGKK